MHPLHLLMAMVPNGFVENRKPKKPLNPYAYSKLLFDHYVRKYEGEYTAQVVGFVTLMYMVLMKLIKIKWLL